MGRMDVLVCSLSKSTSISPHRVVTLLLFSALLSMLVDLRPGPTPPPPGHLSPPTVTGSGGGLRAAPPGPPPPTRGDDDLANPEG